MARKYVPGAAAGPVSDKVLAEARAAAQEADDTLREASAADPADHGWAERYEVPEARARATRKRVEMAELALAARVERSGKRTALVKAIQPELDDMTAGLTASRDQVLAAARGHLKALADLATAVHDHNALVAKHRQSLASRGLADSEVLPGTGEAVRYDEGAHTGPFGGGLKAGGVNWTPTDDTRLLFSAISHVFSGRTFGYGNLMNGIVFRSPEAFRTDGIDAPTLASAGASAPRWPKPVQPRYAPVGPTMDQISRRS